MGFWCVFCCVVETLRRIEVVVASLTLCFVLARPCFVGPVLLWLLYVGEGGSGLRLFGGDGRCERVLTLDSA